MHEGTVDHTSVTSNQVSLKNETELNALLESHSGSSDQSSSCMVSCQNRVKVSGLREVPQAVGGYSVRRLL
jgi:hypothetical protein